MNLTFDEAIANHRKMWNWIADETEKRKEIVLKENYFGGASIPPAHLCFCCEYTRYAHGHKDCRLCPIDWKIETDIEVYSMQCCESNTLFSMWNKSCKDNDWQSAAKYAREIANLPARGEVRR